MPDTSDILAALLAQQRPRPGRVPMSGAFTPQGEQMYRPEGEPEPQPPQSMLDDVFPLARSAAANPGRAGRATLEAVLAGSGMSPGAPGAVMGALKAIPQMAPKTTAMIAALLGVGTGAMPSEAGGPTSEARGELQQLLERQAVLSRQVEQARARRETERKTGEGPRFQSADEEFRNLNDQLTALSKQVEFEQQKNSPAAKLAAEKAQKDFEAQERRRKMNTPFKEMFADAMPYVPYASGLLAGGVGAAIKGGAVSKFNKNITELARRWEQAVSSGNKPLAQALEQEFTSLKTAGPKGNLPAVLSGVGIGELGQALPIATDYAKAVPGSELEKHTMDTLKDLKGLAGRAAQGAIIGGVPAEIAAALMATRIKKPTGFSAETRSMPELPPALGPGPAAPMLPGPGSSPPPAGLLPPPGSPTGQGPTSAGTSGRSPLADLLAKPANDKMRPAPYKVKGKDGKMRWHDEISGDFASPPNKKKD